MYHVYFIQQVKKGRAPVKIGYSKLPEERLKNLQTANACELKLWLSLPFETEKEARAVERTFHWLAKKKCQKLKGEWFIIYMPWKKFIAQGLKIHDGNKAH